MRIKKLGSRFIGSTLAVGLLGGIITAGITTPLTPTEQAESVQQSIETLHSAEKERLEAQLDAAETKASDETSELTETVEGLEARAETKKVEAKLAPVPEKEAIRAERAETKKVEAKLVPVPEKAKKKTAAKPTSKRGSSSGSQQAPDTGKQEKSAAKKPKSAPKKPKTPTHTAKVVNEGLQGAVDRCEGGLTRWTDDLTGLLGEGGKRYYAQHEHCGGSRYLMWEKGDRVKIGKTTYRLDGDHDIPKNLTYFEEANIPEGYDAYIQTCQKNGAPMKALLLTKI